MSKEIKISFLKSHALKYGTNEAILISFFSYWINHKRKKGINYINGRYWNYVSISELNEYFQFLTNKQIRKAINNLIIKEVLIKSNYNKKKYDRTLWYAFIDENEFLDPHKTISKEEKDQSKGLLIPSNSMNLTKPFALEGQPIPINKQSNKQIIITNGSNESNDISKIIQSFFLEYLDNPSPHYESEIIPLMKYVEMVNDAYRSIDGIMLIRESFIALRQTNRRDTAYLLGIVKKKIGAYARQIPKENKKVNKLIDESELNYKVQWDIALDYFEKNKNLFTESQINKFEMVLLTKNYIEYIKLHDIMNEVKSRNELL